MTDMVDFHLKACAHVLASSADAATKTRAALVMLELLFQPSECDAQDDTEMTDEEMEAEIARLKAQLSER